MSRLVVHAPNVSRRVLIRGGDVAGVHGSFDSDQAVRSPACAGGRARSGLERAMRYAQYVSTDEDGVVVVTRCPQSSVFANWLVDDCVELARFRQGEQISGERWESSARRSHELQEV